MGQLVFVHQKAEKDHPGKYPSEGKDGNLRSNPHWTRAANSNANPLMLFACSVDTPIHINRSHLLALRVRVLCELGLRCLTMKTEKFLMAVLALQIDSNYFKVKRCVGKNKGKCKLINLTKDLEATAGTDPGFWSGGASRVLTPGGP